MSIEDFTLLNPEIPGDLFRFAFRDDVSGALLTDLLQLHFLQLSACNHATALFGPEERSILELRAGFLSGSDIDALALEDSIMALANDALDRISADPEVARAAREREDAILLYPIDLNAAREVGLFEASRDMLLTRRFGPIPAEPTAQVEDAGLEDLKRLQIEAIDAPDFDLALRRAGWRE